MKRVLAVLLVLCMVAGFIPSSTFATEIVSSGTCGENLTWTLTDDGTLTISGTGPMRDYNTYDNYVKSPWYYSDSIVEVVIEVGVTSVGACAFYQCNNLNSVSIPDGVIYIGNSAFYGCEKLRSANIPESVTQIGNSAFDCCSLNSVTIPDSVTTIGNSAFRFCSMTSITIPGSVKTIGDNAFFRCWRMASLSIEDGVTSIGSYAFYGCISLTSITIPDSVTGIGNNAFSDCSSLDSVIIGSSVSRIGNYAFYGCSSLTSITIPNSVTDIGNNAFSDCSSLDSVTIGSSVSRIGQYSFLECTSLTEFRVDENNPNYCNDERGVLFSKNKNRLIQAPCTISDSYSVPDGVISIENYAFYGCISLTSITIPDSVTSIGYSAFESCNKLTSAIVGNSVASVGRRAFAYCYSLKDVIFRGNAPTFGLYAFASEPDEDILKVDLPRDKVYILGNEILSSRSDDSYNFYYPFGNPTWPVADLSSTYNINWIPYYLHSDVTSTVKDKTEVNSLIISPVDKTGFLEGFLGHRPSISGVTVSSASGVTTTSQESHTVTIEEAGKQEIVMTKDGYRDYVLPIAVSKTLISAKKAAYSLTAYMEKDRKDGKPYISTVFGRESGTNDPYTDLRVTSLEVTDQNTVDVIITARGFEDQDVIYYIAQDQSRKISSTTGVFSNASLYDLFDDTSTVYAYAMDSSGRVTEPLAIKLSMAEEFDLEHELLADSEWSLLGKDFLKIKISDDIPLLGGTEIDLSAFTFPVGYEQTGDEIKISLGLDFFSRTSDEDGVKWKTFKELLVKDTSFDREALEKFCIIHKLADGKSWKDTAKSNRFNVDIAGYIEGKCTNGEFVVKEGMITIGGRFSFQYVAQGAVWIIPVYGAIEAGSDLRFGGEFTRYIPDKAFPFDATFVLSAEPKVEGKAGVGIKGAISAGLYAEGKLPIRWAFQEQHFSMDLKGEVGVEAELFILHGKKALLEGETSLIDWYYGDEAAAVCLQDCDTQTTSANAAEVVSRYYAAKTSNWLGQKKPGTVYYANGADALAVTDVDFQDLQTSIFANSQPQLVNMGEGMLLVWVEDDASRDTYNRMRLVYSLYDPTTAAWSDPLPVWDDGHNDGYPRMVSDGENVYVLWQKVNTMLDESNTTTVDATLENSELCLARFDADSGTFAEAQMITSNSLYEYAHDLALVNGSLVVHWADAEENALNTSGSNRLYRWTNGTTETVAENLNYILSIDAAGDKLTYVMDTNGDLSTTDDVTAFTVSGAVTAAFDNSEMGAVTYAEYATLDGEQILFLSDMSNIYYEHGGELKSVLTDARPIGSNLSITQTAMGTTAVWTEQVDGWNELYAVSYENGTWTEPVQVSEYGELLSQISLISYGGKLTGVCNANAVIYDETTDEYTKGATDLVLFKLRDFSDIALGSYVNISEELLELGTDAEFYVTVQNNGTLPVSQITFTIADTLGTESVQTVAVEIPSGGSEVVALTYPVPENYTATTLTITAEIEDTDASESDNRAFLTIGQQDLSVTETVVEMLDGGYLLKAVVENGSLVDAQNVTMSVCVNETDAEALQTVTIGTIHRENYALTEVLLKKDALTFDENGTAKVFLKLSSDGNESIAADNVACIVVTQAQQTVCMHPVTQAVEALAPTCTEPGHEVYEICVACGEIASEYREIPVSDHSYNGGSCIWCGEKEVSLFGKSFSLSFEDEILVNFYYTAEKTDDVVEQGMLVFYADPGAADIGKADDVYTGSATDGTLFMNTTNGIAAKYMGDSRYYCAYAKLADGSYAYSSLYQYSPKKYATNLLGKASTSDKQKALCVAMLNYGAAAQTYFGYNTDSLMNADLTDEQKALVVAYDETLFTGAVPADSGKIANFTKTATGFSSRSASVSFEGAFSINYYFTPSVAVNGELTLYYWTPEDYAAADVLTVDNASGNSDMVNSDGTYWGQVSGIAAKKLDDTYYVAGVYTDESGNTYCTGVIAYSLSKYCLNNAKPGKSMQELASATAMYGYYAKNFFA